MTYAPDYETLTMDVIIGLYFLVIVSCCAFRYLCDNTEDPHPSPEVRNTTYKPPTVTDDVEEGSPPSYSECNR